MGNRRPPITAPVPVRSRTARVAVVYEHPLLGEGVARLVRSATGVTVVAVAGDDDRALAGALVSGPWVVIVERGGLLDDLDLELAAPTAEVIEVELRTGVPDPLRPKPISVPEVIDAVVAALAARSGHRVRRVHPASTQQLAPVPEIYPSTDGITPATTRG